MGGLFYLFDFLWFSVWLGFWKDIFGGYSKILIDFILFLSKQLNSKKTRI